VCASDEAMHLELHRGTKTLCAALGFAPLMRQEQGGGGGYMLRLNELLLQGEGGYCRVIQISRLQPPHSICSERVARCLGTHVPANGCGHVCNKTETELVIDSDQV
jgi:hypothetical protein